MTKLDLIKKMTDLEERLKEVEARLDKLFPKRRQGKVLSMMDVQGNILRECWV